MSQDMCRFFQRQKRRVFLKINASSYRSIVSALNRNDRRNQPSQHLFRPIGQKMYEIQLTRHLRESKILRFL